MDNSIKKFKCDNCKQMHNIISWKKIYSTDLYLCDNCWKEVDLKLNIEILEKLINLNIKND